MIKDKPWTPATLKRRRWAGGDRGDVSRGIAGRPGRKPRTPAAPGGRPPSTEGTLASRGGGHQGPHAVVTMSCSRSRATHAGPSDFDTLLTILGHGAPADHADRSAGPRLDDDAQPGHPAGRYYHLTHDYLVPPLRQWLTQKQRETRRGRVEVLLSNLTASGAIVPNDADYPRPWSGWQSSGTSGPKNWTDADRRMMNAATRTICRDAATVLALAAAWSSLAFRIRERERGLVTPRTLAQGRFPAHSRAPTRARFPSRRASSGPRTHRGQHNGLCPRSRGGRTLALPRQTNRGTCCRS